MLIWITKVIRENNNTRAKNTSNNDSKNRISVNNKLLELDKSQ